MKLRVRLSLSMVTLVLIMGLLLALLISKQVSQEQKRDHDRWTASLASALAKAVFRDTLAGNRADVIAALKRSMKDNPEIVYLLVVDFQGKRFAEVNKLNQPIPVENILHTNCQSSQDKDYHIGKLVIRDEYYPLIDHLSAHLHVGFDTSYEEDSLASITRTILGITAILLLITMGIAVLLATRISRPITQLAESLRNYGRGETTPKIQIKTKDSEVRDLIDSFYSMTEQNSKTLQELRAERNFNAAVLENAEALMLVLDQDGRICRFNHACERLSGYSEEEMIGRFPWDTVLPSEESEIIRKQAFDAIKNDPDSLNGNYTNYWLSRLGERFLIEWHNSVLRDDNGCLEYVVSLGHDITVEHAMQEALQESEKRARAVFDQAASGIAYVATDGRWLEVNKRLCEILGYERSFLLSTNFQAITYESDLNTDLSYRDKMLRDEIQNYSMEKRYIKSDGSTIWTNLTVSLVRDEYAVPQYFISVIEDINERKETEQLLRNSERQLREAQRITHIGSWELDILNNKLHWSDEIFRIFEINQADFGASYEAFLDAIHPDDRNSVDKAYNHSLETRAPYEISHRLLMPDGRIKWVNERCESDFSNDGIPIHSLGTVQDITEQVRIEQELRDLNHNLEERVNKRTYELANERNFISTILDTASALVVVLDKQGHIVRINRACEAMTGYTQTELQDYVIWEKLVPPEQHDKIRKIMSDLIQGDITSHYELEWINKKGQHRLIAWSNSTIKDSKGEIQYVIETGVDITERKAAELALIQARDKAEQANRAKSEFLSRMSHELRTPLNAVLGFSQLLKLDEVTPLTASQKECVDEITHAGTHLLDLINEVLDLSRVESGYMKLNLESLSLEPLLIESITLVQATADQRQVQLRLDPIPPEVSHVIADGTRLKQVMLNLLTNAVKFNHEGGYVQITCTPHGSNQVQISVTDTGIGINTEQQARLFEPFERLDADQKAIPGTGIGLALSKHLMELMGGTITLNSEEGKGATFNIIFDIPTS